MSHFLERTGARAEHYVRQYMPDPFVLVLLLTLITFALAAWTQNTSPQKILEYWNLGFWELLSFAMQMVLIVVTGEALAASPLLQSLLQKICKLPGSARSALFILSVFSILLGWLHWGFGLIFASLAGREIAKSLHNHKISVHYPLMGVAAYTSMLLWHAGTTASAPLLINTPGHFLYQQIGIVPLTQTVFLPSNLIVCSILLILIPILIVQLHPKRFRRTIEEFSVIENVEKAIFLEEKPKTFSEKLERSYIINAVVGIFGLTFLIQYFQKAGLNLNHNIVNFLFLFLGILLHRNPLQYAQAITHSIKGTSGIVLQFPFYGGIMGIMRESGLGHDIAHFFIHMANAKSLPFFAYLASVMTKIFIPSGGGEWAVEGPVMLQAAQKIGAPLGLTTMGIAYGNMVGNMFQPFWAIPLLSIMGLKARDIMGYCLVIFIITFPILGVALLLS